MIPVFQSVEMQGGQAVWPKHGSSADRRRVAGSPALTASKGAPNTQMPPPGATRQTACATVCYMTTRTTALPHRGHINGRVGVRELRQNLSVYLERVIAGETLDVTDRGRAVAMLVPLRPGATLVDRLVASGRAIPASRRLEDLPPLRGKIPADLGGQLQRVLQELREDKV